MSQLTEKIAGEIRHARSIPFARFMELALYCPVYGYYEKEKDNIGSHGDYYTSVSCGEIFGKLLACQFAEWLQEQGQTVLVEAGAHAGHLAAQILSCLKTVEPGLFGRVRYFIIEPSPVRRSWQQATLAGFGQQVQWLPDFGPTFEGILFCNELLDAMPVHRLGWDAANQRWFEWGVTLEAGHFAWCRLDATPCQAALPKVPREIELVLPDGFTTETCPAATSWWNRAATLLSGGRLVAFDYGLNSGDFFSPSRPQGTLRAYRRHSQADDVLACPGEQDITAHVNFDWIRVAGESAGLGTVEYIEQPRFLTNIAARIWKGKARFGTWAPSDTRQFKVLTHPDHLGRAFRVLVQQREPAAG